jgi:hypothetical protein
MTATLSSISSLRKHIHPATPNSKVFLVYIRPSLIRILLKCEGRRHSAKYSSMSSNSIPSPKRVLKSNPRTFHFPSRDVSHFNSSFHQRSFAWLRLLSCLDERCLRPSRPQRSCRRSESGRRWKSARAGKTGAVDVSVPRNDFSKCVRRSQDASAACVPYWRECWWWWNNRN